MVSLLKNEAKDANHVVDGIWKPQNWCVSGNVGVLKQSGRKRFANEKAQQKISGNAFF
ncbi:MAG: hypothetical protein Q7U40_01700 [Desulfatirhabdiaceae bacterium]|nr:hypothetical protein [Desulfatirhabdiaceae bacterium]